MATIGGQTPPAGFTTFSVETTPQYIAGWHVYFVDATGDVISEFDSATHTWDVSLPANGMVVLVVRFTGTYDGVHPYQQVYSGRGLTTLDRPTFSQFGALAKLGAVMTNAQYLTVLNTAMPKNPLQG